MTQYPFDKKLDKTRPAVVQICTMRAAYVSIEQQSVRKIGHKQRQEMFQELVVGTRRPNESFDEPNDIPEFIVRDPFQLRYWRYGYRIPTISCCDEGHSPCSLVSVAGGFDMYRTWSQWSMQIVGYPLALESNILCCLLMPFTTILGLICYVLAILTGLVALVICSIIDIIYLLLYFGTCKCFNRAVGSYGWYVQYYAHRNERIGDYDKRYMEYIETVYPIKHYPMDCCPCFCGTSWRRDAILINKTTAQYPDAWYIDDFHN